MLQTLFFKFSGAEQSIELFTVLAKEDEAYVRIGTGILELIASILLFIPKRTWLGALLTVGLMGGAIMSHGGALFTGAAITFISGAILLFLNKKDIPFIGKK